MNNYVITINRLCGCGGVIIGEILSQKLGISLYDEKLLRMASDESGIDMALFGQADEHLKNSLIYKISKKIYKGELIPPSSNDFTSDHNLFNYQAKVLTELAKQESFIAIGRCSDFILKDHPSLMKVFLTADEETCIKQEMEKYDLDEKQAWEKIERKNKERADYYRYYTGRQWSHAGNYDLCINSGKMSYEQCADVIIEYLDSANIRKQ